MLRRSPRSRRSRPLTVAAGGVAVLLGLALVAGCTGSSGTTAAKASPTSTSVALRCQAPCYTPTLMNAEYGILPLLDRGIDGSGETVTILAAEPNVAGPGVVNGGPTSTDIRQDLKALDSEFQLPAARVETDASLVGSASPWQVSDAEAMDAEIVHEVAPDATLRVVLLPSGFMQNAAEAVAELIAGLRVAVSGTDVVAIGFDLGEHFFSSSEVAELNDVLQGAEAKHVTVVADSGDNGAFSDTWWNENPVKEVSLPASDPLVLAAGGSNVYTLPSVNSYANEVAWNGHSPNSVVDTLGASGGGFSHLFARPSYQDGVSGIGQNRGVPDVAGDAAPSTNWPYDLDVDGKPGGGSAAGTDAAAALWAGIMALADQDAHHDLGFVNPAIYRIASGSSYHTAFHDITTGNNTQTMPYPGITAGYNAGPGWSPVTGWGTPDAQVLVPLLAAS